MKQFYILIVFFVTAFASAQIPNGYYDAATWSGYTLKTHLRNIIDLKSPTKTQNDIYSILVKQIISKNIENSGTIQTEPLSSGIDILKFTQGTNSIIKKLIKN